MFVSGSLVFSDGNDEQPNHFLQDILVTSECPVMIVPEDVAALERIAVTYDGKKESMHALKMFCNTFPALTKLPTNIYYWANHTDDDIPQLDYVKEFAARHFTNLTFTELFFDPGEYMQTWLISHLNVLFVCGSYHRSALSMWLKKSFAHKIIKNRSNAVFIAHT